MLDFLEIWYSTGHVGLNCKSPGIKSWSEILLYSRALWVNIVVPLDLLNAQEMLNVSVHEAKY